MLPRALSAEYSGLIAAPGTPNATVTPSRSSTRTAASIALILGMTAPSMGVQVPGKREFGAREAQASGA